MPYRATSTPRRSAECLRRLSLSVQLPLPPPTDTHTHHHHHHHHHHDLLVVAELALLICLDRLHGLDGRVGVAADRRPFLLHAPSAHAKALSKQEHTGEQEHGEPRAHAHTTSVEPGRGVHTTRSAAATQ